MKRKYFKCWKCGGTVYTNDGSKPNVVCTYPMAVRTSGICGGSYTENSNKEEFDKFKKKYEALP